MPTIDELNALKQQRLRVRSEIQQLSANAPHETFPLVGSGVRGNVPTQSNVTVVQNPANRMNILADAIKRTYRGETVRPVEEIGAGEAVGRGVLTGLLGGRASSPQQVGLQPGFGPEQDLRAIRPYTTRTGELAGFLAGIAPAGKAVGALGKLAKVGEATTTVGKIGQRAATSGAQFGVLGAGQSAVEKLAGIPNAQGQKMTWGDVAKATAEQTAVGAVFGGAGAGGQAAVAKVASPRGKFLAELGAETVGFGTISQALRMVHGVPTTKEDVIFDLLVPTAMMLPRSGALFTKGLQAKGYDKPEDAPIEVLREVATDALKTEPEWIKQTLEMLPEEKQQEFVEAFQKPPVDAQGKPLQRLEGPELPVPSKSAMDVGTGIQTLRNLGEINGAEPVAPEAVVPKKQLKPKQPPESEQAQIDRVDVAKLPVDASQEKFFPRDKSGYKFREYNANVGPYATGYQEFVYESPLGKKINSGDFPESERYIAHSRIGKTDDGGTVVYEIQSNLYGKSKKKLGSIVADNYLKNTWYKTAIDKEVESAKSSGSKYVLLPTGETAIRLQNNTGLYNKFKREGSHPVSKFYNEQIGKYAENLGANRVTLEDGSSWFKIDISKSDTPQDTRVDTRVDTRADTRAETPAPVTVEPTKPTTTGEVTGEAIRPPDDWLDGADWNSVQGLKSIAEDLHHDFDKEIADFDSGKEPFYGIENAISAKNVIENVERRIAELESKPTKPVAPATDAALKTAKELGVQTKHGKYDDSKAVALNDGTVAVDAGLSYDFYRFDANGESSRLKPSEVTDSLIDEAEAAFTKAQSMDAAPTGKQSLQVQKPAETPEQAAARIKAETADASDVITYDKAMLDIQRKDPSIETKELGNGILAFRRKDNGKSDWTVAQEGKAAEEMITLPNGKTISNGSEVKVGELAREGEAVGKATDATTKNNERVDQEFVSKREKLLDKLAEQDPSVSRQVYEQMLREQSGGKTGRFIFVDGVEREILDFSGKGISGQIDIPTKENGLDYADGSPRSANEAADIVYAEYPLLFKSKAEAKRQIEIAGNDKELRYSGQKVFYGNPFPTFSEGSILRWAKNLISKRSGGKAPNKITPTQESLVTTKPEVAKAKPEPVAEPSKPFKSAEEYYAEKRAQIRSTAPKLVQKKHVDTFVELFRTVDESAAKVRNQSLEDYLIERKQTHGDIEFTGGNRNKERSLSQALGRVVKGQLEWKDGVALMRAYTQGDFSTYAHELSHYYRKTYPFSPQEWDAMVKEFGATKKVFNNRLLNEGDKTKPIRVQQRSEEVVNWDAAAEERFARSFERYLKTGKAPRPELTQMFAQMKEFMREIYRKVKGGELDIKLHPKIEAVFDGMFGKDTSEFWKRQEQIDKHRSEFGNRSAANAKIPVLRTHDDMGRPYQLATEFKEAIQGTSEGRFRLSKTKGTSVSSYFENLSTNEEVYGQKAYSQEISAEDAMHDKIGEILNPKDKSKWNASGKRIDVERRIEEDTETEEEYRERKGLPPKKDSTLKQRSTPEQDAQTPDDEAPFQLGDPLFQTGEPLNDKLRESPFYLKSSRVIAQKIPNRATGEQIRKTLLNNGVKPDEIKWVLDDLFAQKGDEQITKVELLEHIAQNKAVQIEDVTLGAASKEARDAKKKSDLAETAWREHRQNQASVKTKFVDYLKEKYGTSRTGNGNYDVANEIENGASIRAVLRDIGADKDEKALSYATRLRELVSDENKVMEAAHTAATEFNALATPSKFSSYKSIPGGENYRELVITLPNLGGRDYTSSHWSAKNPVAHIRMDDRVDADGNRVLFVHEMQSDWNREGREKGFASVEAQREYDRKILTAERDFIDAEKNLLKSAEELLLKKDVERIVEIGSSFSTSTEGRQRKFSLGANHLAHEVRRGRTDIMPLANRVMGLPEYQEVENARRAVQDVRHDAALEYDKTPDAPFVRKWQELVAKKVVEEAATGGYDRIAWATGEQVANMFDLRKQVSMIEWKKASTNQVEITGYKDGEEVRGLDNLLVNVDDLERTVGKNIATTIKTGLDKPEFVGDKRTRYAGSISGADLAIGGEWAQALYDAEFPSIFNKIGKRWGSKSGESKIDSENKYVVIRGMGGNNWKAVKHGEKYSEEINPQIFKTEAEALKYADVMNKKESSLRPVNALDITPEMRRAILSEGQELFQTGGDLFKGDDAERKIPTKKLVKKERSTVDSKAALEETMRGYAAELKRVKNVLTLQPSNAEALKKQSALNTKIAEVRKQISELDSDLFNPTEGPKNQEMLFSGLPVPELVKAAKWIASPATATASVVQRGFSNSLSRLNKFESGKEFVQKTITAETRAKMMTGDLHSTLDADQHKLNKQDIEWLNGFDGVEKGRANSIALIEGIDNPAVLDKAPSQRVVDFAHSFRDVTDKIASKAEEVGVKVSVDGEQRDFERIDSYFPHWMTRAAHDAVMAQDGPVWDAMIERLKTASGDDATYKERLAQLKSYSEGEIDIHREGSLEKPRLAFLPDYVTVDGKRVKVLESNVFDVADDMIERHSRRLAIIEQFGQGDKQFNEYYRKFYNEDKHLAFEFKKFIAPVMQGMRVDLLNPQGFPAQVYRPVSALINKGLLSAAVLSQAGGVMAMPMQFGVRRSALGMVDLLKAYKSGEISEIRRYRGFYSDILKMLGETDAFTREGFEGVDGNLAQRVLRKANRGMDAYLRNTLGRADRFLNDLTSVIALRSINEALPIIKRGDNGLLKKGWGTDAEGQRRMLKRFFQFTDEQIDGMVRRGKLNDEEKARVVQRAPASTNAAGMSVLDRPAWMHLDIAKHILAFSSYVQAIGRYGAWAVKEAKENGNVRPIIGLLVGGAIGGEIEIGVKNWFNDREREDKTFSDRLFQDILRAGVLGIAGSFYQTYDYTIRGGGNPVAEQLSPPPIDALAQLGKAIAKAGGEKSLAPIYYQSVLRSLPAARIGNLWAERAILGDPEASARRLIRDNMLKQDGKTKDRWGRQNIKLVPRAGKENTGKMLLKRADPVKLQKLYEAEHPETKPTLKKKLTKRTYPYARP